MILKYEIQILVLIKFFGNIATLICWHIAAYGCFPATTIKLHSCDRDLTQPSKTKIFTIWSFKIRVCQLLFQIILFLYFEHVIFAFHRYFTLNMLKLNSSSFFTNQLLFLLIRKSHLWHLYSYHLSMIKFQMILPHQRFSHLSSFLSLFLNLIQMLPWTIKTVI